MSIKLSLSTILDDDFVRTLAKSADLYKIGSNSVLDPQEIKIGLKVVPRAVMSMLISELSHMEINSNKRIDLPFGRNAWISLNKNAADDYTGAVYDNNKLVYDFKNRSIPGLGIIILSTFELYDLDELSKPTEQSEDTESKVQKLIDERMEFHSLINRVVEDKMAQREAIHKIVMNKLSEAILPKPAEVAPPSPIMSPPSPVISPIEVKPEHMIKKEPPARKGSPLKEFLERKKKPKEYRVEIAKSETVNCPDCGQTIYGAVSGFSACICYGDDQHRKIWLKKTDDGVSLRFSKKWSAENIEMLLQTLRDK
jgi:hypothetical protein